MEVGIIGEGVIGSANKAGFEKIGHDVKVHDLKYNTSVVTVLTCELVFICVPTPSNDDGSCNTEIVESVVAELITASYSGTICIRSTCIPGTTQKLINKYNNDKICFSPEFLRERCAADDFINHHDLLSIGTQNLQCYDLIKKAHGTLPANIMKMSPTEAEILKYFNNVYNSVRIIFANYMYEISERLNSDYAKILDAYLKTGKSTGNYLSVNENLRGYGGMCLPKDTKAIDKLSKDLGNPLSLIEAVLNDNDKLDITVFEGMRK